ncbi:MAG: GYDIA family GHMP kinase [Chitinophagales bacterium]
MKQTYYAHGKLLISGEYLVLRGALALAVPTQYGQRMEIDEDPGGENILYWKNFDVNNNSWGEVHFSKDDLMPFRGSLKTIDADVYETLQKILLECRKSNPGFLKAKGSTTISNFLEFERNWGLGSSSTLINNISKYAGIDPFQLNKKIFGGSGYDIACANASKPVMFKIDEEGEFYDTVNFYPPNPEKIFLVHLGNKQNTKIAVQDFKAGSNPFHEEIEIISEISEALLFVDDFDDFMQLLDEHEEMMQYVLQEEKVKTKLFPDFNGAVKSLGAWGGDFVLAASNSEPEDIISYFSVKGYNTILNYNSLILS